MVERFNGRVSSEVLSINVYSHRALEQLLRGFNQAYNARRQRVLDGRTPNQVTAEHLKARPELANPAPHGAQDHATQPKHASLLMPQRRSHNQTPTPSRNMTTR